MENLLDRFLSYVKVDTQSDPESESIPSTAKQLEFGKKLVEELKRIGLTEVEQDQYGYIYATLEANTSTNMPVIGFIAHIDTAPDFTAENVNPQIHENYDGGDIVLNKEQNIILSPSDFPELNNYIGKTLITTDGTTLLGADDKAGVAAIVTAMEYLINHPEIKHGKIRIAFTPDEEIGRGADKFDVKKFAADFAYTIDGGQLGELQYENFNAAKATIKVKGRSVHPGTAKNQMINAMHVAMEFNSLLPPQERPEHTEGYEGFYHLISMKGDVENAELQYIIRDHDREKFEFRKKLVKEIATFLNNKYQKPIVTAEVEDQYYNMREKIEPVMYIIELAEKAMKELDIEPLIEPIRGGTDGSRLSYMGLPTPNLFTGGHNFHGRFEFIPLESLQKASEVIVKIAQLATEL